MARARRASVLGGVLLCVGALLVSGCGLQPPAIGLEGAGLGVASGGIGSAGKSAKFRTARYAFHDTDSLTAVLLPDAADRESPYRRQAEAETLDPPARAVTLRLMWRSQAARTPIDSDATNCAFQYVVFDDAGQVGVYEGAGFILLTQRPGTNRIDARILKATLLLTDATPGFDDPIGQTDIAGSLTMVRDDGFVYPTIRRLDAAISDRLGYPRLVEASAPTDRLAARR
ncbi:MAG: hypothetical protein AAGB29_05860 [Planctomycetota bacterium]